MGEPIKRATLGAVAKEYEARGNVGGARQDQQTEFNPGAVFFGVNTDAIGVLGPIQPGDELRIIGFYPPSLSYANAVRRVYRNKIKLEVALSTSDAPKAVALTGAKYRHICRFKAIDGNLYFADVYVPDPQEQYLYVDVNGTATNEDADAFADILFMTPVSNNRAVAMCNRTGGGGGNQELQASVVSNELVLELV